ncbi:hypothetical protein ABIB99_007219 [Bradyrhizobium sp. LA6.1]|uniref:hypothetical protein n=1 Tax=Bradyrhizobium sp. LA6.1 TaxID=3156378 RepID=UPI0033917967
MSEEDNFIGKFRENLRHVDVSVAIALNAHLEIEGNLDDYLRSIFAHPKYLEGARLSFFDKLSIARAYTPATHDRPEWEMMTLINTIRNKIAHRSRDKALQIDVSRLRTVMSKSFDRLQAELKGVDPKEVITYAAAICCGFLILMEEEVSQTQRVRIHEEDNE